MALTDSENPKLTTAGPENVMPKQANPTLEYYQRIAPVYFERHNWQIQRFTTRVENRWLRRLVPVGSRVLIVAAGGGREIPTLLSLDARVTALDYSERMVGIGRERFGETAKAISWHVADAHDLKHFRDDYDVVLCLGAVNYFQDDQHCMNEMVACCRPGGLLLVTSFNRQHPSELKLGAPKDIIRRPYSTKEIEDLVKTAGASSFWMKSFRIWVDRMPSAWNRPNGPFWGRLLLACLIGLEEIAEPFFGPSAGKFLFCAARRDKSLPTGDPYDKSRKKACI